MDNRRIFNNLAESYINEWDISIKEKQNIKKIIEYSHIKKGDIVLEPGCGKGDFSLFILNKIKGTGFLYSVDIAEQMLHYAKIKLKKYKNIKLLNCDASRIKLKKETFDKVICFNCFAHFYPKEKYVKEFYRVLKKNGYLIIAHSLSRRKINAMHKKWGFDIKKHYLPSVRAIKELLKKFKFKMIKGIDREIYFIRAKKQ